MHDDYIRPEPNKATLLIQNKVALLFLLVFFFGLCVVLDVIAKVGANAEGYGRTPIGRPSGWYKLGRLPFLRSFFWFVRGIKCFCRGWCKCRGLWAVKTAPYDGFFDVFCLS